jgi:osmotically-inducible protein OsmY
MKRFSVQRFFAPLLCCALTGCVPAAFMGGSSVLVATAGEDRSFGSAFDDTAIRTSVNAHWLESAPGLLTDVEITVREGRVLLTGAVDSAEQQVEAVRLAWKANGVKEVIDHITVGEGGGFTGYARDSLITAELRSDLTFCEDMRSGNYTIKTVDGVVYLMGIAQSQSELEKAVELARKIGGVQKVISYVRVKEDSITPSEFRTTEADQQTQVAEGTRSATTETQVASSKVQVQSLDEPNTVSSFG